MERMFQEPLKAFRFLVELDGRKVTVAAFTGFSGIQMDVETIQVRAGDDIHHSERRIDAAGDTSADEAVRPPPADHLHGAYGGIDLADAGSGENHLVSADGADTVCAGLTGVFQETPYLGALRIHCGCDADSHGVRFRVLIDCRFGTS